MKHADRHILTLLVVLIMPLLAYSQDKACTGTIYQCAVGFRLDSASFSDNYEDNAKALAALDSVLSAVSKDKVDSIEIVSTSSPEGSYTYNFRLSKQRCDAIADYLRSRYPGHSGLMVFNWKGEAWDDMRSIVTADTCLAQEQRDSLLQILDADLFADARKTALAKLSCYGYIKENIFPRMRVSAISVYGELPGQIADDTADANADAVQEGQVSALESLRAARTAETVAEPAKEFEEELEEEAPARREFLCPPFALKTNLLFDAALAFNGEIEVPVGPHISLAAEWTAPWWLAEDNTWCYEANMANIEARWWWGDRSVRPMLSGFFTGVYYGNGRYDFQNPDKGRQGIFYNVGLGAGYAWTLGRSWGLEAMAGFGWFETRSELYVPRDNYTILAYRQTQNTTWLGPTRAKISLYYKFGQKKYDRKYRMADE